MVMKAVQQLLFDVDWTSGGSQEDLDVLVIDTPPGTGDVALSLGQLVEVDGTFCVSSHGLFFIILSYTFHRRSDRFDPSRCCYNRYA